MCQKSTRVAQRRMGAINSVGIGQTFATHLQFSSDAIELIFYNDLCMFFLVEVTNNLICN